MSPQAFGILAGVITAVSGVVYALRAAQGKTAPIITSWALWTFIGLALLVTYRASGARDNVWPALIGFVNPMLIVGIAVWRRGKWIELTPLEAACIPLSTFSLGVWYEYLGREDMASVGLMFAIFADACAALPTIFFVFKNPSQERPLPWAIFGTGYFLSVFAIEEATFSNYVLPIYMTAGSFLIAAPILWDHYKRRVSLLQWI